MLWRNTYPSSTTRNAYRGDDGCLHRHSQTSATGPHQRICHPRFVGIVTRRILIEALLEHERRLYYGGTISKRARPTSHRSFLRSSALYNAWRPNGW